MRVLRHGVVDSTNERALASVVDGSARHGDVHVAEAQTAGRGRRGNAWVSARGEGLYLSLVLLPPTQPRPVALTMGAGLAVLEAVHALGAGAARLKWPNDVLAGGAKLAGILVEARGLAPAHAVVGIGLNVRQREFPAELERERAVTSLARLGLACSPENVLEDALAALLARLGERMETACERPAEVVRAYTEALGLVGREVRVRLSAGEATGRLGELTLDGLALEGARSRHLLEHVQALEPL